MRPSCWLVLCVLLASSVAHAQTSPAEDRPPDATSTAPDPAPAAKAPAKTGGKAPSAVDFTNRVTFVILGSAVGTSVGAFGGSRLGTAAGSGSGGFGDVVGALVGLGAGGAVGAGLGTILLGSLMPGDGNKFAGAMGALIGTGVAALLTIPLVFVVGPFALIVPLIATVAGYQLGYGMAPAAKPTEPAKSPPVASVLPFANVSLDGSGGRVGLVGTF
jgi:hypothetical protein